MALPRMVAFKEGLFRTLSSSQGSKADLNNVIITTGSTQAIEIFAEVFLMKGIQSCGSSNLLCHPRVFDKFGAQSIAVATDDQGLIIEDLEAKIKDIDPKFFILFLPFKIQQVTPYLWNGEKNCSISCRI